uniref:Uncharacterized protein n=1 Tax=Knipowitschia caucasica TaxID=637954 RepID=A0AAV2MFM3_KNICA
MGFCLNNRVSVIAQKSPKPVRLDAQTLNEDGNSFMLIISYYKILKAYRLHDCSQEKRSVYSIEVLPQSVNSNQYKNRKLYRASTTWSHEDLAPGQNPDLNPPPGLCL